MMITYEASQGLAQISDFKFQISNDKGSFFQSASWSRFMGWLLKDEGRLYVLEEEGEVLAYGWGWRYPIGRWYWVNMPMGPMLGPKFQISDNKLQSSKGEAMKVEEAQIISRFAKELAAVEKGALWVRITPPYTLEEMDAPALKEAHASYIPASTLRVNLESSEEDILAQMKQKGRYNIRLASKRGVEMFAFGYEVKGDALEFVGKEVLELRAWGEHDMQGLGLGAQGLGKELEEQVFEAYDLLNKETTARDGFSGHSKEYYKQCMRAFGEDALILLARYEEEWVAAGLFVRSGDTFTYYYGASSSKHSKAMAPYLLQWTAMRYAKELCSCIWYDFLGITDGKRDTHLTGVTSFKKKFGGEEVHYLGSFEVVNKPLLVLGIRAIKWIRNLSK